ncbi:hypothetical protein [Aureimonas leprariae]|uniref:Uncharacterized protein n=1 Tax=Plantimonas leprariae TaxID=2615207 RepID=A0A7V7PQE0_9HYPH|nr:hypothetical protein [Aureimonas leprariae]KAB0680393.1 hypothetical protein F6X38_09510 [Aureimonas leprariae]
MGTDGTLFENRDWAVTAEGLEHQPTGYFIEREQLGRKRGDGFLAWPLHMLEKAWIAPDTFAEAFVAAARLFVLPGDALASTFAEAGLTEAASGWRRRTAEIVPHPALSVPDKADKREDHRETAARRRCG